MGNEWEDVTQRKDQNKMIEIKKPLIEIRMPFINSAGHQKFSLRRACSMSGCGNLSDAFLHLLITVT